MRRYNIVDKDIKRNLHDASIMKFQGHFGVSTSKEIRVCYILRHIRMKRNEDDKSVLNMAPNQVKTP